MNAVKTILISLICLSVSVSADNLTGSKAPGFEMPDQNGKMHKLSDYAGQWVVMYFYPRDDTPGCTVEAGAFRDMKDEFTKLNATIIGVSVDGTESHQAFHEKQKLNFNLLSDIDKSVSKDYDVLKNLAVVSFSSRQTFIIDPMGMIAHHFEEVDPDTHAPETLAKLKEIQEIFSK